MQSVTVVSPKVSRNVGTSVVQIGGYSPASSAIVTSLMVANTSGGTILVKVSLYDGANDTYLAFNMPIAVGDSLSIGGEWAKFTLIAGWSIRVISNTATSCDASMCVTEFT